MSLTRRVSCFAILFVSVATTASAATKGKAKGRAPAANEAAAPAAATPAAATPAARPATCVKKAATCASGNGSFAPPISTSVADSYIEVLAAGDFNGDGKDDFITSGHNLWVTLNKGDGTFEAPEKVEGTGSGYAIAVGDFDGDCRDDFAMNVVSGNGNALGVFLSKSDGSFRAAKTTSVLQGAPLHMFAVDMNNDHKLDVVYDGNSYDNTTYIAFGDGKGGFSAPAAYDKVGSVAVSRVDSVGDLNGDGFVDVVTRSPVRQFAFCVALNDRSGTLEKAKCYSSSSDEAAGVTAIGDTNGDGFADIALALDNNTANIFMGKGDGTFDIDDRKLLDNMPPSQTGLYLRDFNGDGMLDLVFYKGEVQTPGFTVFFNPGKAKYKESKFYGAGFVNGARVAFGDFLGTGMKGMAALQTRDAYRVDIVPGMCR